MDCYEFSRLAKEYKEYGKDINRKEWIKNWGETVQWSVYYDCQIYDIEEPIEQYCLKNDIPFLSDGGWIHCISNRKQYNDIMKLIDEILYSEDEASD